LRLLNATNSGGFSEDTAGYDIAFQCPFAVPMVLMLSTHPSRDGDILSDQTMRFSPGVNARDFFDPYGNICTRLVAPPGLLEVRSDFVVEDSGLPDAVCPTAQQWDVVLCPVTCCPSYWPVVIAIPKSFRIWLGRFLAAFRAGGSVRRRFVTTLTIASNLATITQGGTVPPRKVTRNAAAFAGTSPISP
jgi:hypothetical protein